MRWDVGSGKNINILNQPWLKDESNPFITSNLVGFNDATIEYLICADSKVLDRDIVEDLFNERDQR